MMTAGAQINGMPRHWHEPDTCDAGHGREMIGTSGRLLVAKSAHQVAR